MNDFDRKLLERCKRLIEERFEGNPQQGWRQRDLDRLSIIIEEKSGIKLSLSTLKRLWRDDYQQIPHPSTLNALASLIDFQDWYSFKEAQVIAWKKSYWWRKPSAKAIMAGVTMIIFLFLIIQGFRSLENDGPIIHGEVHFSVDKTLTQGVPNTVLFEYDVSNVEADSFFLQQSWNKLQKDPIDPTDGFMSSVYYTPGFHRAKLLADDSIIAQSRVHVTTAGWVAYMRHDFNTKIPEYLNTFFRDGYVTIDEKDLANKKLDLNKDWIYTLTNVNKFNDVSSNDFELVVRVRSQISEDKVCPWLELRMILEEHIFYVPLITKGCVANARIKVGEEVKYGNSTDLSNFGVHLDEWQVLTLKIENKQATIFLAEDKVYEDSFERDFGLIRGLSFRSSSPMEVDFVTLKNKNGETAYNDLFRAASITQ